ncbi:MAG: ubiquinone/menaquinone biosynthesis methyltransferase [Pseudomonadota bacterium]|nr:ubiquinone/menaquinone biosynthesis methyltransferase [Pseudomonadota bacterium]
MNFETDHHNYLFGYERLNRYEKTKRIDDLFNTTADHYDLMNNLMSMGLHHLWKKQVVAHTQCHAGDCVLDLAAGSCDMTYYLRQHYPNSVHIIAADPSENMLSIGRNKLYDQGIYTHIDYCRLYAEQLPFPPDSMTLITLAFGFRNFTDQPQALHACHKILKPNGTMIILEFSTPKDPTIALGYHYYSEYIIPILGHMVANNPSSYQYLIDSIKTQPSATEVQDMMVQAGFSVSITPILSGLINIYIGTAHQLTTPSTITP